MDISAISPDQPPQVFLIPGRIKFVGPVAAFNRKCYELEIERLGNRQAVIASVEPMIRMLRAGAATAGVSIEEALQLSLNHFTEGDTDVGRLAATVTMLATAAFLANDKQISASTSQATAGPGG